MISMRSATAFKVLCWAIGILAAALLCLVGLMVWSVMYGQDGPVSQPAPHKPANKPQETPVDQVARTWDVKFWPEKPAEEGGGGPAVDSFSGYRCGGWILSSNGKGAVILVRESDNRPVLVWENDTTGDISVKKISGESVVVKINGQVGTLRKAEFKPAVVPGRRPPGMVGPPAAPNIAAASAPATSYRMAATSGEGGTVPGVSPASGTASGSVVQPSGPGVNWRQYWADRQRRAAEGQRN